MAAEEFVPPTPEEVDKYIAYLGWPADFDGWMFCDYYEAQGWVTGTGREIKAGGRSCANGSETRASGSGRDRANE